MCERVALTREKATCELSPAEDSDSRRLSLLASASLASGATVPQKKTTPRAAAVGGGGGLGC